MDNEDKMDNEERVHYIAGLSGLLTGCILTGCIYVPVIFFGVIGICCAVYFVCRLFW